MKFNNKILGLIFIGLVALYFGHKILNKPKVRSFKDILVMVDTSAVDKIVFYPKGDTPKITLTKNGNSWTADDGETKITATSNSVNTILGPSTEIKTLQLISKNETKWAEYEVDDNSGKKVELYNGSQLLSAFYVGRFNFNQNTRSAKTYMRLANENDIYVVDGFLSMSYEKQFDDFRNKKLINNLDVNDVLKIKVQTDSENLSFEKDINGYWVDSANNALDSLKMSNTVRTLINLRGNEVINDYQPNQNDRLVQLTMVSDSKVEQSISIYKYGETDFACNSTSNKNVFFKSDKNGLYKTAYLDLLALVE